MARGCCLPKSSRTVWTILKRLGLITRAPQISHEPLPLADPLEEVQMDFQDATTVERDWSIDGKVMHLVEVLTFVDRGTSLLLSTQARSDFHAATALEAVIDFLREHGRPQRLSFDHDPRWVGGSSGWDFPSALIHFLWGVGVDVRIPPVHQPWHNAFVERYRRSYKQECLYVDFPRTLEEVRRVTADYQTHDNHERPHQGRACRHQPPRVAFPKLPPLPALPKTVQADAWLFRVHGKVIKGVVGSDGAVQVNHEDDYLGKAFASRSVALQVDADQGTLHLVEPMGESLFPIKHLVRGSLPLDDFIALSLEQALSEERLRLALKAPFRKGEWDPTRFSKQTKRETNLSISSCPGKVTRLFVRQQTSLFEGRLFFLLSRHARNAERDLFLLELLVRAASVLQARATMIQHRQGHEGEKQFTRDRCGRACSFWRRANATSG